jgi:hypothetical protein
MSVKSGQSVTVDFTTANPTTGAAANADALPTGKLVVNGIDNAATVTVTNKATGVYKAAVTLPTLTAGDVVSIRVAATVATVAGVGVVWTDVADTKRVSDLKDEAMRGTDGALTDKTGFSLTAAYDAAKAAASQASVDALPTDADVQAAAQAAIVAEGVATATALATVGGVVDGIAVDYARRTGDYNTVAPLDAAATQAAAQAAIVAEGVATATALAEVDTVVDGIAADYAKTGEAAAAATGVGLSAGSLTNIYNQAVAALNAYDPPKRSEATADKNEILGAIATVDGIVDDILADTGTTIPAAIAATDAKVDTVDGILDTTLPQVLAGIAEAVDGIAVDYAKTGEAALAVATLNDFDPATDVVAHVTLVDTTTTNTDMRGTDSAMLAASYTEPPTAAQNADAVWDEAVADHVTAGTFGRFLQRVYRYFFNKRTHTNSSVVVYADDGVTPDATMTVTGDATTVTKDAPA